MGGQARWYGGRVDLIDDDGNVSNDETRKFLLTFIDRYAAWIAKIG